MKSLFQYAVLLHEYKKNKDGLDEYEGTKIIIDLKTVLAKNKEEVAFKATREIPEDAASNPERVQIVVRPF